MVICDSGGRERKTHQDGGTERYNEKAAVKYHVLGFVPCIWEYRADGDKLMFHLSVVCKDKDITFQLGEPLTVTSYDESLDWRV